MSEVKITLDSVREEWEKLWDGKAGMTHHARLILEYETLQRKHTALVAAVRDFCAHAEANVHEWENYYPLTYLVNEEEVRHLQLLLVAAVQEQDDA